MMDKKIIKIDEKKCVGCSLCVSACQGGAIGLVDGKARLLREDYCDGLGNCLPICPTKAISFETAAPSVVENSESKKPDTLACGCPSTHSTVIERGSFAEREQGQLSPSRSHLNQWPVQIKLVPTNAPYFDGANLLIAADCSAYAYGNFHNEFMKNRVTIIGCPKLDDGDYSEKLTTILKDNDIMSVTVARMEVPCCSGIEHAAKKALQNCGKTIPSQVITFSTDGNILGN